MHDILIIDDDAFVREMYVMHLQADGRTIRTSEGGRQSMAEIERQQPDLLLLDIIMPRMDGFSILDFIKEKGYAFPIIILSNVDWDLGTKASKQMGVVDYFVKSNIDLPTLVKKVEGHLASQKTTRPQ